MYEITFHFEDGTETVEVGPDEYVLDAAERAGLELPHSCRNGMCTSCAGELLEGDLDGHEGTALSPAQEDDGYVLLCCSYPRADSEIRVGERVQNDLLGLDAL
ncbi:2Fe-2S iron-sulfur cluster-binding protein [Haloterrigena alkaliphila]|uniref:2Fe-2S iron-sulfur cluster binding domain-containing protein n=1 Tax=Haloterrigena alkaliphila TaxID=2816475 RepID=A0A8A2VHL5_9EURY|nr:2Fe-2S iron-sulfur cluster-binding protein [Haloterrigena alkaliphila]QSW99854.1 2Fe-2S iron-sulfur cluster-binding protein [Haloterrigena alkaliphila]